MRFAEEHALMMEQRQAAEMAIIEEAQTQRVLEDLQERRLVRRDREFVHRVFATAERIFGYRRSCTRRRRRRWFVAYWIARRTRFSFPAIGRMLGGRDHTTIMHAVRKYPDKRAKMGRKVKSIQNQGRGKSARICV